MTTHYITADDYDRWNPGEPIEDVASDFKYLVRLWEDSITTDNFLFWLGYEVGQGNIIRIETDKNGNILS